MQYLLLFKGMAYSALSKSEEAIECFSDCLKMSGLGKNYKMALQLTADELLHVSMFEEALEYVNTLLELDPSNFEAWYIKGNAFYRQGRVPVTERTGSKSIKRQRSCWRKHSN